MIGKNNESVSHFAEFLNYTGFKRDFSKGKSRQTFICPDGKIGQFSFTTKGNKPQARQFYEDAVYLFTKMEEDGNILYAKVSIDLDGRVATRVIPKCGTRGYNVKFEKSDMKVYSKELFG